MMGAREVPGVVLLGGTKNMEGTRGMVDMESMPGVLYPGCQVLELILGIQNMIVESIVYHSMAEYNVKYSIAVYSTV